MLVDALPNHRVPTEYVAKQHNMDAILSIAIQWDMVRCNAARHSVFRCDGVRFDTNRHDETLLDIIQYDFISFIVVKLSPVL